MFYSLDSTILQPAPPPTAESSGTSFIGGSCRPYTCCRQFLVRCENQICLPRFSPSSVAEKINLQHSNCSISRCVHMHFLFRQSLPLTAAPEVFGLHDNASITRAQSDTVQLLKSVLLTESSGGGSGGVDKETTINAVAVDILSKVGTFRIVFVAKWLASFYVLEPPVDRCSLCPTSSSRPSHRPIACR